MGKIAASDVIGIVMGGTQDAGGGALMRCFGKGAGQGEERLGQPGFPTESGGDQRTRVYGAGGEALAAIALLEFQCHQGIAQLGLAIGIKGGYAVLFLATSRLSKFSRNGYRCDSLETMTTRGAGALRMVSSNPLVSMK